MFVLAFLRVAQTLIVGETETSVIIAYTVGADQLISNQTFNSLCENADLGMNPDAEDTDKTEYTESEG